MVELKPTYGIIGYPVEHSLSPLMHNTAFKALGVDAVYKLFPLASEEMEGFIKNLRQEDSPIFGLNVTVPYKEVIIPYLDSLSPFAQKVMSVNTIVIDSSRRLAGYNTDGPGFLSHLVELGFDVRGKRVAIMGAGGTTRSILASLSILPERPQSIRIYNRTTAKVKILVKDLAAHMDMSHIQIAESLDDLNIELADLLINTTSVGLKNPDDCLIEADLLHKDMLVYDVVYNPRETRLLCLASHKGAKIANGLGMLFYQGVLALQHWAGQEIPDDVKQKMRQALEKGRP